jgi:hypothetical protein
MNADTTGNRIRELNAAMKRDYEKMETGWHYVNPDNTVTCVNRCRSCTSTVRRMGGLPHNGCNGVFEHTGNAMGWPLDMEVYPHTRLVYLVREDFSMEPLVLKGIGSIDVAHLDMVASRISDKQITQKFFDGNHEMTVEAVDAYMQYLRDWIATNIPLLRPVLPALDRDTARSVAETIENLYNLIKKEGEEDAPQLAFLDWLSENKVKAWPIAKLLKVKVERALMEKESDRRRRVAAALSNKFDPATQDLDRQELRIQNQTHQNGVIVLKWDAPCDLDLHVSAVAKDGTFFHVFFRRLKELGLVALDHDNTKGGRGATEMITFDSLALLGREFTNLNIHVLAYNAPTTEIPVRFEVKVTQHGVRKTYRGCFDKHKHVTGSDLKSACFTQKILIHGPEGENPPPQQPLPEGFQMISHEELVPAEGPTMTVEPGKNDPVFALMRTPEKAFKEKITSLRLGGQEDRYQLTTTVTGNKYYVVGEDRYLVVGSKFISTLPLAKEGVHFIKSNFHFGQSRQSEVARFRGKAFFPYQCGALRDTVTSALSLVGMVGDIAWIMTSYAAQDHNASLFVKVRTARAPETGKGGTFSPFFWRKYL